MKPIASISSANNIEIASRGYVCKSNKAHRISCTHTHRHTRTHRVPPLPWSWYRRERKEGRVFLAGQPKRRTAKEQEDRSGERPTVKKPEQTGENKCKKKDLRRAPRQLFCAISLTRRTEGAVDIWEGGGGGRDGTKTDKQR